MKYLQDCYADNRLQIIFVSVKKLEPDMADKLWYYKMDCFSKFETHLFLQTIDKDRKRPEHLVDYQMKLS